MRTDEEFMRLFESFNVSEDEIMKMGMAQREETIIKKGEGFKKFRKCNNSQRPKPRKNKRK